MLLRHEPAAPQDRPEPGSRPARESQTWRQDVVLRWGARAWALVGLVVVAYLLFQVLVFVRVLLAPVLVALLLVYLLNPLVGALQRRGLPRPAGTAIAAALAMAVVVGAAMLVVPVLVEQVRAAAAALPSDLGSLERQVEQVAARVGADVDVDLNAPAVQKWLEDDGNRRVLFGSLITVGSVAAGVAGAGVAFLVGVVLALFVLTDLPRLGKVALRVVPPRRRAEAAQLAGEVGTTIGGFLRGQLIVAAFVGVASALALWVVGLPLWLLVGVVAGVTNLVPYVGPFVGGALAVTIALVDGDVSTAVWAAVAILVVQQVESHVVAPMVMGQVVRLHPAVILLVVLLGGSVAGLLGLLLAVPLAASAHVLVRHLWRRSVSWADDPAFPHGPEPPHRPEPPHDPATPHDPAPADGPAPADDPAPADGPLPRRTS